jgi:hypothetical protein
MRNCVLERLKEGILPSNMDQINVQPEENVLTAVKGG